MLGGEEDAVWEAACAAHASAVEAQLLARAAQRDAAPPDAPLPAAVDADADDDGAASEGGDGVALDDWRDDEWGETDDADAAAAPYADALAWDAADAAEAAAQPAAKRVKQADLRQWFGGVPAPPPRPRVQSTLRTWLGVAPPAAEAAAPPAPPLPPRACPHYKRVVNTPFAVDAFTYGAVPGVVAYFLSHFHADHYMGLTSAWDGGPIYCSEVTAALVALRLRVRGELLRPLPLNARVRVPGSACHVTLLEANHCPGACLLLFETAGAPADTPFTLHTGDFRAAASLRARPDVARLAGRIGTLYLDTTYCDSRYAFPTQEDALAEVAARCVAFRAAHPRGLVLVGAYAIGKERVALAAAAALRCGVYCEAPRARTYACFRWSELDAALTRDPAATPLHIVPIAWLNGPKLRAYLARHPRHDALLALRPTGWAHAASDGAAKRASAASARDGRVQLVGVPYSEHSSAEELRAFVRLLRPRRVVPTVGVGAPEKRLAMTRLIDAWLAEPDG